MRAEPATLHVSVSIIVVSGHRYPEPSMETCFPSTVSCTSAFLLDVALNCLAPVGQFACLPNLTVDLKIGVRSILKNRAMEKEKTWQKSNHRVVDYQTLRPLPTLCASTRRKTLADWLNKRASSKVPRRQDHIGTREVVGQISSFSSITHQDAFYCRRNWRSSSFRPTESSSASRSKSSLYQAP